MSDSIDTKDHEVSDFTQEVVERSREKPVLVDFWAPWCGPGRQLSPTLERLAEEATEWELVKVNTDENQEVARRYGIRGIPNVKLFLDGEPVEEFTGALPRHQIEQWLEENLPSESKETLARAEALIAEGENEQARTLLEELISEDPEHHEAHILLARSVVLEEPERAVELLDGHITDGESEQVAENVQTLAELLHLAETPEDLPDEDGKERFLDALQALSEERFEEAVEAFIAVIQTNRYYQDDASRRAWVALFDLLGPEHEVTRTYRRTFDVALY
jgi:putative thioredoxin